MAMFRAAGRRETMGTSLPLYHSEAVYREEFYVASEVCDVPSIVHAPPSYVSARACLVCSVKLMEYVMFFLGNLVTQSGNAEW